MRKCICCGVEMDENYKITSGYGIVIRSKKGLSAVKPKVAVCPQCGEVSIYVEEPENLKGKSN